MLLSLVRSIFFQKVGCVADIYKTIWLEEIRSAKKLANLRKFFEIGFLLEKVCLWVFWYNNPTEIDRE